MWAVSKCPGAVAVARGRDPRWSAAGHGNGRLICRPGAGIVDRGGDAPSRRCRRRSRLTVTADGWGALNVRAGSVHEQRAGGDAPGRERLIAGSSSGGSVVVAVVVVVVVVVESGG